MEWELIELCRIVTWIQNFLFFFLSPFHFFLFSLLLPSLLLLYLPIPDLFSPIWVHWRGMWGRLDTEQNGGPHLLHLLAGDGVFMATMILAMAEFNVTEGLGWEFVTSLAGGCLYFERSNALNFCFSPGTDMGVSSLLWDIDHDLETNKFTEAEEVEGYWVIALAGFDTVGGFQL